VTQRPPLTHRTIFATWWPLALSWILMSLELPIVSAVMARLADPEIHLAAYGSVVFPLSMLIEAPIIMLLVASTALVRDRQSYVKVRGFMVRACVTLGAIHVLVATTPLFDLIVGGLIGAPEELHAPARIGLLIMIPWTPSIAYRRFHQGILIRFGRSRAVGAGTGVRLAAIVAVSGLCALADLPGVVVGAAAVATGVLAEALVAGLWARPVIREALPREPEGEPVTTRPSSTSTFRSPSRRSSTWSPCRSRARGSRACRGPWTPSRCGRFSPGSSSC
jgi:hypothetical protein